VRHLDFLRGYQVNCPIVSLARNGDLEGVVTSMKQMEDRFNKKFKYPYVFLNEQPFDENFKKWVFWTSSGTMIN
jgi:alpha 1,2-mannosyltransferase